jgi:hypothetical protein
VLHQAPLQIAEFLIELGAETRRLALIEFERSEKLVPGRRQVPDSHLSRQTTTCFLVDGFRADCFQLPGPIPLKASLYFRLPGLLDLGVFVETGKELLSETCTLASRQGQQGCLEILDR